MQRGSCCRIGNHSLSLSPTFPCATCPCAWVYLALTFPWVPLSPKWPQRPLWEELGPSLPSWRQSLWEENPPTLAESKHFLRATGSQTRPGHMPGPLAASSNHRQLPSPACFGDLDKCLSYSKTKKKKKVEWKICPKCLTIFGARRAAPRCPHLVQIFL